VAAPILQLTDPHIGADWQPGDPLDTLRAVLDAVRALPQRPVAALLTGDLTADGSGEQYAALAALLSAELEMPVHAIPGNHDDRTSLRAHFEVGGAGAEPIQYAVELGGLRLLMIDTTIPGEDSGELGRERLDWIEAALAARPEASTLLAMHHPPFLSGVRDMDRLALAAADREALTLLVADHPHVCGVVAGHVHRAMLTAVGGRPAMAIPSTYCQLRLDFEAPRLEMVPEPIGFALHTLVGGRLVSHIQTLPVTA
jgi:3',5'-cyclic-AMP phosphodiesterase